MDTNQGRRPAPGDDNVAQLKRDIDSGRTGDTRPNADPALSPLGTDDEAGGHPPTAEQVALARQQEARIGVQARGGDAPGQGESKRRWAVTILVGVVVLFIVVIAAKVVVGH